MQSREATAAEHLIANVAGTTLAMAKARWHARRPPPTSPPPSPPPPLPAGPPAPPVPPSSPAPPLSPPLAPSHKARYSLFDAILRACVRAYGFSDCADGWVDAGATVLVEPLLGSDRHLFVHAIDAVVPQLRLQLGMGLLGGANIEILSGTAFTVRRNVSDLLSTSDASPLNDAGEFVVGGQAGSLSGELSVTGYGFASAIVPASPQQSFVLLGEAVTRGNRTLVAQRTTTDFVIQTAMKTQMVRESRTIEVDLRLTGSFTADAPPSPPAPPALPPSAPRTRPAPPPPPGPPPPGVPHDCASGNIGSSDLLRCPQPPLQPPAPTQPPPRPPPTTPPPPSAPPGVLVEAPQQITVEQALFTFRPHPSGPAEAAGVFTPAGLEEMAALYRTVVGHPRFEEFCLRSRPFPTAPLACEPPRSPLQLFYGRSTSHFRQTDFLAFELPRFENMSLLVASLGIGPLLFAEIAGTEALLNGCQSACAQEDATECQLSTAMSTLPSDVQLQGLEGMSPLGASGGASGGGSTLLNLDMIDTLGSCSPYRELLRSGFRRCPWSPPWSPH